MGKTLVWMLVVIAVAATSLMSRELQIRNSYTSRIEKLKQENDENAKRIAIKEVKLSQLNADYQNLIYGWDQHWDNRTGGQYKDDQNPLSFRAAVGTDDGVGKIPAQKIIVPFTGDAAAGKVNVEFQTVTRQVIHVYLGSGRGRNGGRTSFVGNGQLLLAEVALSEDAKTITVWLMGRYKPNSPVLAADSAITISGLKDSTLDIDAKVKILPDIKLAAKPQNGEGAGNGSSRFVSVGPLPDSIQYYRDLEGGMFSVSIGNDPKTRKKYDVVIGSSYIGPFWLPQDPNKQHITGTSVRVLPIWSLRSGEYASWDVTGSSWRYRAAIVGGYAENLQRSYPRLEEIAREIKDDDADIVEKERLKKAAEEDVAGYEEIIAGAQGNGGILAELDQADAARNKVQATVDGLRRAVKRSLDLRNSLTLKNRKLSGSLPQPRPAAKKKSTPPPAKSAKAAGQ